MTTPLYDDQTNLRVLFVCTANVCRSPLAAGLMKLRAAHAGAPMKIASAGTLAEGVKSDPHVVSVLAEYGVDAAEKRSRLLTPELIANSHLILAMTITHARRVISESPEHRERVFLLREAVQLASSIGPRSDDMPVDGWLRTMDAARTLSYASEDPGLEISDPIGKPRPVFVDLASELDQNLSWLITLSRLGTRPR